jgi:hypothetical protein
MIQTQKKLLETALRGGQWVFMLCVCCAAAAPKQALQFSGSIYSDLGVYHTWEPETEDTFDFAGRTTLNLGFVNTNRRVAKMETDLDVFLLYGAQAEHFMAQYADTGIDINAVEKVVSLFSLGGSPVLFDVRKMYCSLYFPFADITIGRQIINFGKGIVFSPIDVFSSVELTDIMLRRRGSDIVAATIPLGALSGMDAVVQLPFADAPVSSALKLYASLFSVDFSAVGIYKYANSGVRADDEAIVGLTAKGDLEIGLYGEAVAHLLDMGESLYPEAMLGADYSIQNRWFFALEYLYKDYRLSSRWGEHNLFGQIQYSINDLMNVSALALYDFERDAAMGMVQYFYNILQNANTLVYIRGYDNLGPYDLEYALRVEVLF